MRIDEARQRDGTTRVDAPGVLLELHTSLSVACRTYPDDPSRSGCDRAVLDDPERAVTKRRLAGHELGGVHDQQIGCDWRRRVRSGHVVTPGRSSRWRFAASMASG